MQEKIAGANYILNLYADIENFNKYIAAYKNIMLELGERFKDDLRMESNDTQKVKEITNYIRYLAIAINIKIKSLSKKINEFDKLTSDEVYVSRYNMITSQVAPEFSLLEEYATKINQAFVNGVVDEILTQSSKVYQEFYGVDNGEWDLYRNTRFDYRF